MNLCRNLHNITDVKTSLAITSNDGKQIKISGCTKATAPLKKVMLQTDQIC